MLSLGIQSEKGSPVEASSKTDSFVSGFCTVKRIESGDARPLEKTIDVLEPLLEPIKNFVLPGGSPVAARIHFARTVCRRAERAVVRLSRNEDIGEGITIYLNRLSDLLFVLARYANHVAGVQEIHWKS